jgi:hypothetical protein
MNKYELYLDGDAQGEPPHIYVRQISDKGVLRDTTILEVFDEPTPLVENPNSFEDSHWDFPEWAKKLVMLMNEYSV